MWFVNVAYLSWDVACRMLAYVSPSQPANIHVMRILRNAPPSNIVRNKSDKVSDERIIIMKSYNRRPNYVEAYQ